MMLLHEAVDSVKWREFPSETTREVASEVAVAIVVNGTTHAVMMATPADLEDFAIGFAVTEGVIRGRGDIERFETFEHEKGIEARLWLGEAQAREVANRRRAMAGPSGCGLCGIESLDEALRDAPTVDSTVTVARTEVLGAMAMLRPAQKLNALTHAVHAAALWNVDTHELIVREDVGRHNALDKLVGASTRGGLNVPRSVLLLTSRVSIEMVQKAATLGVGIMVAVSAPTTLAIKIAAAAGITLVAVARADGFEVFTHPHRITG